MGPSKSASASSSLQEKHIEIARTLLARVEWWEPLSAVLASVQAEVASLVSKIPTSGSIAEVPGYTEFISTVNADLWNHNENNPPLETSTWQKEVHDSQWWTIELRIRKLGQTELNLRKVSAWIEGKNLDTKPPLFSTNRERINGKKQSMLDFFETHYGDLARSNALYTTDLQKLDNKLYRNIGTLVPGGVSSLLPTKSDKVSKDIEALKWQHSTAYKILANAYKR